MHMSVCVCVCVCVCMRTCVCGVCVCVCVGEERGEMEKVDVSTNFLLHSTAVSVATTHSHPH